MGVLRLNEDIQGVRDSIEEIPFRLSYQALEFTFFALSNVGGIGLQSAKDMETEAELYNEVAELIAKQLETARKELKEVQYLQEKWAAYEQGFYYEREEVFENENGEEEPLLKPSIE
jgi:hypothetical protein